MAPGPDSTIVDGNGADRVYDIFADGVTISGMTIQNGNVPDLGGGLLNSGAHTRLINVVVRGNTAFHNGGGSRTS